MYVAGWSHARRHGKEFKADLELQIAINRGTVQVKVTWPLSGAARTAPMIRIPRAALVVAGGLNP